MQGAQAAFAAGDYDKAERILERKYGEVFPFDAGCLRCMCDAERGLGQKALERMMLLIRQPEFRTRDHELYIFMSAALAYHQPIAAFEVWNHSAARGVINVDVACELFWKLFLNFFRVTEASGTRETQIYATLRAAVSPHSVSAVGAAFNTICLRLESQNEEERQRRSVQIAGVAIVWHILLLRSSNAVTTTQPEAEAEETAKHVASSILRLQTVLRLLGKFSSNKQTESSSRAWQCDALLILKAKMLLLQLLPDGREAALKELLDAEEALIDSSPLATMQHLLPTTKCKLLQILGRPVEAAQTVLNFALEHQRATEAGGGALIAGFCDAFEACLQEAEPSNEKTISDIFARSAMVLNNNGALAAEITVQILHHHFAQNSKAPTPGVNSIERFAFLEHQLSACLRARSPDEARAFPESLLRPLCDFAVATPDRGLRRRILGAVRQATSTAAAPESGRGLWQDFRSIMTRRAASEANFHTLALLTSDFDACDGQAAAAVVQLAADGFADWTNGAAVDRAFRSTPQIAMDAAVLCVHAALLRGGYEGLCGAYDWVSAIRNAVVEQGDAEKPRNLSGPANEETVLSTATRPRSVAVPPAQLNYTVDILKLFISAKLGLAESVSQTLDRLRIKNLQSFSLSYWAPLLMFGCGRFADFTTLVIANEAMARAVADGMLGAAGKAAERGDTVAALQALRTAQGLRGSRALALHRQLFFVSLFFKGWGGVERSEGEIKPKRAGRNGSAKITIAGAAAAGGTAAGANAKTLSFTAALKTLMERRLEPPLLSFPHTLSEGLDLVERAVAPLDTVLLARKTTECVTGGEETACNAQMESDDCLSAYEASPQLCFDESVEDSFPFLEDYLLPRRGGSDKGGCALLPLPLAPLPTALLRPQAARKPAGPVSDCDAVGIASIVPDVQLIDQVIAALHGIFNAFRRALAPAASLGERQGSPAIPSVSDQPSLLTKDTTVRAAAANFKSPPTSSQQPSPASDSTNPPASPAPPIINTERQVSCGPFAELVAAVDAVSGAAAGAAAAPSRAGSAPALAFSTAVLQAALPSVPRFLNLAAAADRWRLALIIIVALLATAAAQREVPLRRKPFLEALRAVEAAAREFLAAAAAAAATAAGGAGAPPSAANAEGGLAGVDNADAGSIEAGNAVRLALKQLATQHHAHGRALTAVSGDGTFFCRVCLKTRSAQLNTAFAMHSTMTTSSKYTSCSFSNVSERLSHEDDSWCFRGLPALCRAKNAGDAANEKARQLA